MVQGEVADLVAEGVDDGGGVLGEGRAGTAEGGREQVPKHAGARLRRAEASERGANVGRGAQAGGGLERGERAHRGVGRGDLRADWL